LEKISSRKAAVQEKSTQLYHKLMQQCNSLVSSSLSSIYRGFSAWIFTDTYARHSKLMVLNLIAHESFSGTRQGSEICHVHSKRYLTLSGHMIKALPILVLPKASKPPTISVQTVLSHLLVFQ